MKYPIFSHFLLSRLLGSVARFLATEAMTLGLILINVMTANVSHAQSTASEHNPSYWLNTGSNQPLTSMSMRMKILPWDLAPLLLFNVGFSTEEPASPATIHDNFSVTLVTKTQTNTTILLSADAYGILWAPSTPGGFTLNSNAVVFRDISFSGAQSSALMATAFSVAVILPQEFAGQDAILYLDLFDNQDQQNSVAYLDRLRIESGVPPIFLQSATKVNGPFADEDGIVIDRRLRIIALPKQAQNRFFRLKANVPVAVRQARFMSDREIFEYEFVKPLPETPTPAVFSLESSSQSGGPYGEEPGATIQPTERTVTLWRAQTMRFYRIRADVTRRIVEYTIQNDNLLLSYE